MSLEKLNSLNYESLRLYRGFGVKSEIKLRKLLETYTYIFEEQLDNFSHKAL
jgi:DNA repair protein RadC